MTDRYRTRQGQYDYRDRYGSHDRQVEQYSNADSDWQQGDSSWRGQERNQRWQSVDELDRGYGRSQNFQREDFNRASDGYTSDTSSLDDYDRESASRFGRNEPSRAYDTGNRYGGNNYSPVGAGYGRQRSGSYGSGAYGTLVPPRQYDRDERGFFDRASDEVMSWFGDDDAARRRKLDNREDHRGRGPSNYTRSNERLLEDACERLTRDPHIDASKIDVTCADNEVTLTGTVDSRSAKRRAEDIVDDISGVKHVQNNLRVQSKDTYYGQTGTGTLTDS